MPGAERLRDSAVLTDLVAQQKGAGKLHAAICATPAVAFEPQGARPPGLAAGALIALRLAAACCAQCSTGISAGAHISQSRPAPPTHPLRARPPGSTPAGVLAGKRATAHPAFSDRLSNQEAVGQRVVVDGQLLTSRCVDAGGAGGRRRLPLRLADAT